MNKLKINPTYIPFLDDFLEGGIPAYSLNLVAGLPGAGKTILVQNIIFNYLKRHKQAQALYFTTISEPTLKIVRYLSQFDFFSPDIFGERLFYYDLHEYIVRHTLKAVTDFIWKKIEEKGPSLLVIDSFKAISDMVRNEPAFRLFCYDLSMRLATVRCTSFLVGEYSRKNMQEDSEFAVADGIFFLDRSQASGTRRLEVHKLRGQKISLLPLPYIISRKGVQILGWRYNGKETSGLEQDSLLLSKEKTGIWGLDEILTGGFRRGQGILVSGASGSGKTSFCLNLAYNYALQGKKVVYFSFEETPKLFESFYAQLGLDYAKVKSKLHFRYKFLSNIILEEEVLELKNLICSKDVDVIFIDSLSMLLHKLKKNSEVRDYCYYLQKYLYQYSKLGFFTSDIHFGKNDLSRSGAEETIFDGVINLSLQKEEGFRRHYLEVYKLRGGYTKKGLFRWLLSRDKGMQVLSNFVPLKVPVPEKKNFFLSEWTTTYPSLIVSLGKDKKAIWKIGARFLAEAKENKEDIYIMSLFKGRAKIKETLRSVGFELGERVKIVGPLSELEEDKELLVYTLLTFLKKENKPARVFVPLLGSDNTQTWLRLLNPLLEATGVVCWFNLVAEGEVERWRPFADIVVYLESSAQGVELKGLQGQRAQLNLKS